MRQVKLSQAVLFCFILFYFDYFVFLFSFSFIIFSLILVLQGNFIFNKQSFLCKTTDFYFSNGVIFSKYINYIHILTVMINIYS